VIALDLGGRVALVTGASGGIGAGIARRLGEAGATVVAHYRRDPAGAAAVAERTVGADLAEPGAIAALLEEVGPLDIVVHNAADQRLGELATATPEDWREVLAVNVEAVAELTRQAAARMIAEGRRGAFVTIASIEGLQPAPAHGPYAASKAALLMYTRAAAAEYGPHGIRCNAVCPGLVDRPGLADDWPEGVARWTAAAPLQRLGRPTDVADAVVFLASDLAAWVTGATLLVDGGVLARPTW
jgi:NAD(P)-dependent dehydrogenase (short-subunit alcohol dehydrogenase family)